MLHHRDIALSFVAYRDIALSFVAYRDIALSKKPHLRMRKPCLSGEKGRKRGLELMRRVLAKTDPAPEKPDILLVFDAGRAKLVGFRYRGSK
jgi:hypothetical protein